jgi:hypothetical protein
MQIDDVLQNDKTKTPSASGGDASSTDSANDALSWWETIVPGDGNCVPRSFIIAKNASGGSGDIQSPTDSECLKLREALAGFLVQNWSLANAVGGFGRPASLGPMFSFDSYFLPVENRNTHPCIRGNCEHIKATLELDANDPKRLERISSDHLLRDHHAEFIATQGSWFTAFEVELLAFYSGCCIHVCARSDGAAKSHWQAEPVAAVIYNPSGGPRVLLSFNMKNHYNAIVRRCGEPVLRSSELQETGARCFCCEMSLDGHQSVGCANTKCTHRLCASDTCSLKYAKFCAVVNGCLLPSQAYCGLTCAQIDNRLHGRVCAFCLCSGSALHKCAGTCSMRFCSECKKEYVGPDGICAIAPYCSTGAASGDAVPQTRGRKSKYTSAGSPSRRRSARSSSRTK